MSDDNPIMSDTAQDVLDRLRQLDDSEQLEILREWFCSTWNKPTTPLSTQYEHAEGMLDQLREAGYL